MLTVLHQSLQQPKVNSTFFIDKFLLSIVPANEEGLIRETRLDWHGDPFINEERCFNLRIWLKGAFEIATVVVINFDGNVDSSRLLSSNTDDWALRLVTFSLKGNQTLSIQSSTASYLTQNGVLAIDEVINKPVTDANSCIGDDTTSSSTSTTLPTEPPYGKKNFYFFCLLVHD